MGKHVGGKLVLAGALAAGTAVWAIKPRSFSDKQRHFVPSFRTYGMRIAACMTRDRTDAGVCGAQRRVCGAGASLRIARGIRDR